MKHKDIILLLISASFLTVVWVAFNIYHNSVLSTTPEILEKETLPLNPNFDEKTINKLKERKKVSPIYNLKDPSPSPVELTPSPEASPAGENITPIASEGGGIVP